MSTNRFYANKTVIEYGGQPRTVLDLARESGLEPFAIYQRWRRGDRGERLMRPLSKRGGWQRLRSAINGPSPQETK